MKHSGSSRPRRVFVATSYAGTMLITMVLGYRGGMVVDGWAGTSPLFTALGLLLGVGISLGILFREVLNMTEKDKK